MTKKLYMLITSVLIALLLFGCGSKSFTCAMCMKEVNQKPRDVTLLGQTIEICNSCNQALEFYLEIFR